jgi:ABC-type uncharacterized transport system permease subunit
MRIKLEKRREPSMVMLVATPVASVILTMLIGLVVFDLIGINGFKAVVDIFLSPIIVGYKWGDVALKAAPLIIIALGLSVGNRAQVWNIGAEGQYVIGALCAAGVGVAFGATGGFFVVLLMVIAGIIGGGLWGAIPALLPCRC